MKVSAPVLLRVSKIVQKKRFVKDILKSIVQSSGTALLVGGAVRDVFLNLPVKDLDFEVYGLTLEQLQSILELYGPVSLIGKSFGVLRVHGLDVDWSLPRKDSSGRHPIVSYDPQMSYEQAFIRRDVTVNAMGIDMESFDLIDPFGGMQDLEHKILRSPDLQFFGQDPLRLLRVMQFAARFGMQVDDNLSQLCATMDMSSVSIERIEQEFAKLFLQATCPSIGLKWLVKIGKFNEFLAGVQVCDLLWTTIDHAAVQIYRSEQEKLLMIWAVVMTFLVYNEQYNFMALSLQDYKSVVQAMRLLSRHDQLIYQVAKLVNYAGMNFENITDANIKWLAVWLAPELSIRFVSECIALRYSQTISEFLLQRAVELGVADHPESPLLTGKDFLDVAVGIQIGLLVKQAYQLQIDQNIKNRDVLKTIIY